MITTHGYSGYRRGCRCDDCIAGNKEYIKSRPQTPAYRESQRRLSKDARLRYRMEALVHYSQDPPSCKCCGETLLVFLTIDHIDGKGTEHRREVPAYALTRWLKNNGYPGGYQVLCWNCNSAKHILGECPCTYKND